MSNSPKKGYEKYKIYFYFGLLNGAVALAILIIAVLSTINGDPLRVQISGYAAGIMWLAVALLSSRVYFAAKKIYEERLDDNEPTL